MSRKMPLSLLSLPHEVLHNILVRVDPQDVARLPCSCRMLNSYIKNNRLLFKELYLSHFDEPGQDLDNAELSWEVELPKFIKTQKILESDNVDIKRDSFEDVIRSVFHLISTAAVGSTPSLNIPYLTRLFAKQSNMETILCGSFLYDWAKSETWMKRRTSSDPVFEQERPATADTVSEPDTNEGGLRPFVLRQLFLSGISTRSNGAVRPTIPNTRPPADEARMRQLSAKLHCLYGVPVATARNDRGSTHGYKLRSDTTPIHPFARSLVYDLRQRNDGNFWGPFMDDGSQDADWEKLEAIMIILYYNTSKYAATFERHECLIPDLQTPFVGATPYSFVSHASHVLREPKLPLEARDPYNITGTWMRVVCFLDYTELFSFNFATQQDDDQPRPPLDTEEAFRLIVCKLTVKKVEPPGEDDGKALPVVWFDGKSCSLRPTWDPNANSKIRGCVRLTPEGEVRWTTWSIFHGEERWRSEGIQIGGVQSARGVLGTWFDKDFDEHGPAGPTCFWKHSDGFELCRGKNADTE